MGDESVSNIYQGGYSSLKDNYGPIFTGYRADISRLGVSTDPRTANILKEVSEKIAPGQKVMELSLIDIGEATASIPKQHLDEVRRLSKLTGVEITVHGAITDASGIRNEGREFSEERRQEVERKLFQSIERSHQINPDGNIPVTFHTSNQLMGPTWEITKDGKEEISMMPIVNVDTKQVNVVKKTEHYYPTSHRDENGKTIPVGEMLVHDVQEQLRMMNDTEWKNSLRQIEFDRERAERIMQEAHSIDIGKYTQLKLGQLDPKSLSPEDAAVMSRLHFADEYIQNAALKLQSSFDIGYKSGNDEEKKELKKISEEYQKMLGFGDKKYPGGRNPYKYSHPKSQSDAIGGMVAQLEEMKPQIFVPMENYALEQTAKSYGNVALEAYKKFGEHTPIINIENPPAGGGLSRAKDLKDLIIKSQDVFVESAIKSKSDGGLGMSKDQAKKEAEKMIGATWDVGHINQLRKFGFSGKDIIKEAEIIAPLVRHVHLSDNFGLDNVELPMGMGNVDFKEVMEKLGKHGKDARKIIEAAHWWQFQQTSPVGVSMEALGSPIYSMGMAPYWNQKEGLWQGYSGGLDGTWLPQVNYETFGGGFSNLPKELGGQRGQTGRSRMSGTPME